MSLAGKVALVVGATGNTGRAVALDLAGQGAKLAVVARGQERLNDVGNISPTDCFCCPADLMIAGEPERVVKDVAGVVGMPDIVVHVLGGSAGIREPLAPSAEWARVWHLNLGIAHEINRAVLPAMVERGWGRIVHFSSNGVKLAIGNAPYTAAKAAVEGYVRTMSKEFSARGVVITAVSPGPIFTEGRFLYSQGEEWTKDFKEHYLPMKRWGTGSELARVVGFLCSEGASYMAGAVVDVDGGMR